VNIKDTADSWAKTVWDESQLDDKDKMDPMQHSLVVTASSMGFSAGYQAAIESQSVAYNAGVDAALNILHQAFIRCSGIEGWWGAYDDIKRNMQKVKK
jgi:hypothetical protein